MTRATPDWGGLQAFLAVAARGSIAAAAAHLGVNHSTVLRRLARLEANLGTRLFDRLREGYALTASGNVLSARLHDVPELVEDAERFAAGGRSELRGRIRLAASDVVIESLLLPPLLAFRRRHPGVHIELSGRYAFDPLPTEDAELAVRGADSAPTGLAARRVGDILSAVYAARDYVAARPGADAGTHRWVALVESPGFANLHRWMRRHVPDRQVVMRVDSLTGLADAVAAGIGVGLLPVPLASGRRDLVPLSPPDPDLRKPIWLLMPPDLQRVPRLKALYTHLAQALPRSPALVAPPV